MTMIGFIGFAPISSFEFFLEIAVDPHASCKVMNAWDPFMDCVEQLLNFVFGQADAQNVYIFAVYAPTPSHHVTPRPAHP